MTCRVLLVLTTLAFVARPASAQDRPLRAEMPEGVGAGNVLVETAVDFTHGYQYPLSGLNGNLGRYGLLRLDFGLSSIADFELSGGLRDRLSVTSTTPAPLSGLLQPANPSSTSAFDDIVVATKLRLLTSETEGEPAVSLRIATRLPNAKHPSGLGQDTTDFFTTLIGARTFGDSRVAAHLGAGVMGDPLRGNRRVGTLLYAAMLSQRLQALGSVTPSSGKSELVVAVEGRTGPDEPGLEPRGTARGGAAVTVGRMRVEADATFGLTSRDGSVGFALTAGFAFHAFNP